MKTCSVEGCEKEYFCKGFCRAHYRKLSIYGDPFHEQPIAMNKTKCKVDGCSSLARKAGFCRPHYDKYRRYGDPTIVRSASPGEPLRWIEDRIKQAEHTDECWTDWPFKSRTPSGYPVVRINGKNKIVSNLVLALTGKEQPDRKHEVLHSCDNPLCINPAHLRWGTRDENVHDMMSKGRDRVTGEKSAVSLLTESQVREIKANYRDGKETQTEMSKRFGVSISTINGIVHDREWKHIK